LSSQIDLSTEPLFLSAAPVADVQRRQWLHTRIDRISVPRLQDLFPALDLLLRDP
jgi:hypothetical protein